MQQFKVLFIAGFSPIVRDGDASGKLYRETFDISFKEESGGYFHTEALNGANTFALWPLSQAAQSCFGRESWPSDTPIPQAWLEFDVDSVENATAELEARGYRMLIRNKKSPGVRQSVVSSHQKDFLWASLSLRQCEKEGTTEHQLRHPNGRTDGVPQPLGVAWPQETGNANELLRALPAGSLGVEQVR